MPAIPELDKFYHSTKWRKLRKFIVESRRGICEKCGKPGAEVHHKIPISIYNVNDISISLNPDNLELLCKACHDKERTKHFDVRSDVAFDENGNMIKKT